MTTPLTPRGGTIAGGVVLLLIATALAVIILLGAWSWSAIVWLVVLFGGLLVVAGIIGGIARAVARPRGGLPRPRRDRPPHPPTG